MSSYAKGTSVSVEKSKAEIESTLIRFGADQFASAWTADRATIMFRCHGRHVRFVLPLPRRDEERFTHVKRGKYTPLHPRSPEKALQAWEQGCREQWRALAACIKAKLVAVESGITTFEDEFLAHIVLPSGETAGQWMQPQIAHAYETSQMPPLLPALPAGGED